MDIDLRGKCYLVTGANSGLGFAATEMIAKRVCIYSEFSPYTYSKQGGSVHMICRNQERGEKARQEIIQKTSNQGTSPSHLYQS